MQPVQHRLPVCRRCLAKVSERNHKLNAARTATSALLFAYPPFLHKLQYIAECHSAVSLKCTIILHLYQYNTAHCHSYIVLSIWIVQIEHTSSQDAGHHIHSHKLVNVYSKNGIWLRTDWRNKTVKTLTKQILGYGLSLAQQLQFHLCHLSASAATGTAAVQSQEHLQYWKLMLSPIYQLI